MYIVGTLVLCLEIYKSPNLLVQVSITNNLYQMLGCICCWIVFPFLSNLDKCIQFMEMG